MRLELNARGSWAVVGEFPPAEEGAVRHAVLDLAIALGNEAGPTWRITGEHDPDSNSRRVLAYLPRPTYPAGFEWSDA